MSKDKPKAAEEVWRLVAVASVHLSVNGIDDVITAVCEYCPHEYADDMEYVNMMDPRPNFDLNDVYAHMIGHHPDELQETV